MNDRRRIEILLVEDSPADARLTDLAIKDSDASIGLSIIKDGEEALAFLHKKGQYTDSPSPDFIILDLNLQKRDGREVLAVIKGDEKLKHIPVAILTTSDDETDIMDSYRMHANCYLIKPVGVDRFIEMIKFTTAFWFKTAKLPS
ncbi:putative methanogenesis regulatory protein FilR2 [uncultured archaeon]|nr:putative methanogenesis regulatory protein FilR2 [uncultured archaeon]